MQIVYGGDEGFAAAISGLPDPDNQKYFQEQMEMAKMVFGHRTDEYSRRWLQESKQLYEKYNSEAALSVARAALNQVRGIFQADVLRRLWKIEDFQIATPMMQRYLMAEPMTRQLYYDQQIDGYSHQYVDNDPGCIGEDHYDWRRVHDGVLQEDEDGLYFVNYAEKLREGDHDLSLQEQSWILSSWESMKILLSKKLKDPTSAWNNDL